jgi:hypothetical protein
MPDQTKPNPTQKKANTSSGCTGISFAGKSNTRAAQVQTCRTQGIDMNIHPWILLTYWMQGKVKKLLSYQAHNSAQQELQLAICDHTQTFLYGNLRYISSFPH